MNVKTLAFVCAGLVNALPAVAQVERATVTGAVHDASGAAVSGVSITLTYPATGLVRPVTSNEQGAYFVTSLPVGSAVVRVEKDGFRPIRMDTDLKVGETRTLDFTLDLAGVEATVEVVAPIALVHNSAGVGAVLENRQVSQLPINGRNWGNL